MFCARFALSSITGTTQTFPILNTETGEELSTDEIFRRTEFVLRRRFARITRVSELLGELEEVMAPSKK